MVGIENGIGLEIVLWFQQFLNPLLSDIVLPLFDQLGSEDFYIIGIPMIYWCIDAAFGRRFSLLFLISIWDNSALKELFQRPRPYQIFEQTHVSGAISETFGLPSGHAQGTAVFWGTIAYQVKKRWVTIAVIVYTLLMMVSRMMLGAHYPQDVILGALVGLAWLGAYIWLEPRISRWINARSLWEQIGIVTAIAGVMLVIHPLLIPMRSPETLAAIGTTIATLFGAGIGFAIETRSVRFRADGILWKRVARFILGLVVLMAIRLGLGIAFEGFDGTDAEFTFRFIRYALIGAWIGLGAPYLFVKIKLAEQED